MPYYSPLRYPGGKRKLLPYLRKIITENNLSINNYVEPYAGGSAVALDLLFSGNVNDIYLNDIDKSIYAFWNSVMYDTDRFCEEILSTGLSISEWENQKAKQENYDSLFDLGFSTFYLNRTNRSGIINGGVIGGKQQDGDYSMDARFNKSNLISRIRMISEHQSGIHLFNLDALDFLKTILGDLERENTLIYLDPPYFLNGKKLYSNYYKSDDHKTIKEFVESLSHKWIISYDNVEAIKALYKNFNIIEYSLSYTAQEKTLGEEIMIFSNQLTAISPIVQYK